MCCLKQCYYCFTKAFPHPEIFIQYNLKPTVLHPSIMALSFIIIVYDYSFDNKNLNLMMIQKTTYPNIDILLGRRLKVSFGSDLFGHLLSLSFCHRSLGKNIEVDFISPRFFLPASRSFLHYSSSPPSIQRALSGEN